MRKRQRLLRFFRSLFLTVPCSGKLLVILFAAIWLPACQPQETGNQADLRSTQQALQTSISTVALQMTLALPVTQTALHPTSQPAILPSATLQPSPTSLPIGDENPTPTSPPPTEPLTAKILVFESISGQRIYGIYQIRYIREALDYANITYIDVGSAQGWFLDKLRSDEKWDLIIASSEANSSIQGEFAELLYQQLKSGAAMILELWDLNRMRSGKIAPLLDLCGVGFYADLKDVKRLAMYPLVRDHPIFHTPNASINLQNISPFWQGDNGDLLKITGSGDARLLAGTNPNQTNDHGTIAECLQGRMIIQTFRSHDLALLDSEALWQNYVYYVLRDH